VPYTEHDARAWALGLVPSEWAQGEVASVAVVDAVTDELLGAVAVTPGRDRTGEVGYWTAPWARDAAWPSARRGCTRPGPSRRWPWRASSCSRTCATRPRSASAEKAGFVREGVARAVRAEPRGPARVDMVVWAHVP
jgi:RimJ/RimL family protein N-acetyltransferase